MSLTKLERNALLRLRAYVTLERASLTPPARAQERGYPAWGDEKPIRPLVPDERKRNLDYTGDPWTNDVAESLVVYTESWVLPIIDALLDANGKNGGRDFESRWLLEERVER